MEEMHFTAFSEDTRYPNPNPAQKEPISQPVTLQTPFEVDFKPLFEKLDIIDRRIEEILKWVQPAPILPKKAKKKVVKNTKKAHKHA